MLASSRGVIDFNIGFRTEGECQRKKSVLNVFDEENLSSLLFSIPGRAAEIAT
jgi:hypothetical protein